MTDVEYRDNHRYTHRPIPRRSVPYCGTLISAVQEAVCISTPMCGVEDVNKQLSTAILDLALYTILLNAFSLMIIIL